MAQHDVFRTTHGDLLLDCQSDFLDDFNTRFVVPLINPTDAPKIAKRLNPVFQIDGQDFVMYTQFAASVSAVELRDHVASLDQYRYEITTALDTLIGAY